MSRKNNPNPNNKPTRVPTQDSWIAQDGAILPRRRIGNIKNTYVSSMKKIIFLLFGLAISSCAFADWDSWSSSSWLGRDISPDNRSCTIGTSYLSFPTKDSADYRSVVVSFYETGKFGIDIMKSGWQIPLGKTVNANFIFDNGFSITLRGIERHSPNFRFMLSSSQQDIFIGHLEQSKTLKIVWL